MSRVQPPGSPCGSPFSTPYAANLVGGAQVASAGLMYFGIENDLLEAKWLSNAPVGLGSFGLGLGIVPEHRGVCSPGWDVPSSHLVVWLVVIRLASFW